MATELTRRQSLFFLLVGGVVGLLLAGLVIPLGFGDDGPLARPEVAPQAPGDPQPGLDADAARDDVAAEQPEAGAPVGDDAQAARESDARGVPTGPESGVTGDAEPKGASGDQPSGADAPPDGDGATGDRAPAGATEEPAPLRATDRGVTADAIRLGLLLIDLGGAGEIGVPVSESTDPEEQRRRWDVWISDINDRGGIHGRTIEPYYYSYDGLSEDDQRAVCRQATEDDEVFAALLATAMTRSSILCFTREHATPFVGLGSLGFSETMYQGSQGLLFSLLPEGPRTLRNFVAELHQLGELRTQGQVGQARAKVLGLVSHEGPGVRQTIERNVVAPLEGLGYEVAQWAELSGDLNTSSTQIPLAVNQMRSNGVEAILLLTGALRAPQFVQEADAQRYHPEYYVSDFQSGSVDTYVRSMPDSFDAMLITARRTGEWRRGDPMPPFDAECVERFEARTGEDLERTDEEGERNQSWGMTMFSCTLAGLFERAATDAGPELTRPAFSRSLQSLGDVPLAHLGGGSFAPGKFGAADLLRTSEFRPDCTCWWPVSPFRQPPA